MESKWNSSTRFLLPLLFNVVITKEGKVIVYDKDFFVFNDWFINCYMAVENKITESTTIYIAYKLNNSENFEKFETSIIKHPYYKENFDYNKAALYVFDVPLVYEREINLFKQGLYSLFSDKYKSEVLKFWHLIKEDDNNFIYRALYETDSAQSQLRDPESSSSVNSDKEYWVAPNIQKETLISTPHLSPQK